MDGWKQSSKDQFDGFEALLEGPEELMIACAFEGDLRMAMTLSATLGAAHLLCDLARQGHIAEDGFCLNSLQLSVIMLALLDGDIDKTEGFLRSLVGQEGA